MERASFSDWSYTCQHRLRHSSRIAASGRARRALSMRPAGRAAPVAPDDRSAVAWNMNALKKTANQSSFPFVTWVAVGYEIRRTRHQAWRGGQKTSTVRRSSRSASRLAAVRGMWEHPSPARRRRTCEPPSPIQKRGPFDDVVSCCVLRGSFVGTMQEPLV